MVKTKKEICCLVVGMMVVLVAPLNFCSSSTIVASTKSYSFVYNYGNAKIWVFIALNQTLFIGSQANDSISLTVYLEKLGSNIGVFINRLTLGFEGTQTRKIISPNVTLNNNTRSWTCNVTLGQEDVGQLLLPGQILARSLDFEFRYEIIDSSGEYWSYRVNETIPALIQSYGQGSETWISFGTVFLIISVLGVVAALIVLWLRIRKYRKTTLIAKRKEAYS